MSLDRADRSFIRRALADAVDEITEAIAAAVDDVAATAAAADPDDADDATPDADADNAPASDDDPEDAAASGDDVDDDASDDGRVAMPTCAIAAVAQLTRGTRCVIVGRVAAVLGDTARGFGSFSLHDVLNPQAVVRIAIPTRYSELARHIRDGAIVAVDGIVDRPIHVIAMIVRVLAAPPPGSKPAVVPGPASKPNTPLCWPVPAVISCRVGCGSSAPQWERRPETKYYVYVNASSVYMQCALHGNWLKTDGKTIQRADIPVYMISAPPVPGATRLWCETCGPLCDTWLVAEDADGRPRLYCGGTTFVDGEHRPLHAYRIDVGVSGGVALVPIPHPDAVAQATQVAPSA